LFSCTARFSIGVLFNLRRHHGHFLFLFRFRQFHTEYFGGDLSARRLFSLPRTTPATLLEHQHYTVPGLGRHIMTSGMLAFGQLLMSLNANGTSVLQVGLVAHNGQVQWLHGVCTARVGCAPTFSWFFVYWRTTCIQSSRLSKLFVLVTS